MLRFARKTLVTLEVVVDIACHARPHPVCARSLTQRHRIPRRYLEQTMRCLVEAGLLKSTRGPKGGYALAQERRKIRVGDIVRLVEKENDKIRHEAKHRSQTKASPQKPDENIKASPLGAQVIYPLWQSLHDDTLRRLDTITIDDLCRKAHAAGFVIKETPKPDFTI